MGFLSFLRDRRGATAAEYALLLVAVLLAVGGGFRALGGDINEATGKAGAAIQGSGGGGASTVASGGSSQTKLASASFDAVQGDSAKSISSVAADVAIPIGVGA